MGCGSSGGGQGNAENAMSRIQIGNTQQNANKINQAFNAFDPKFYTDTRNAFMNNAMPQFGNQQRGMTQQLGDTLANRGLWHSSAGDQSRNALSASANQGQMSIGNMATQAENAMRQQVAGERQNLMGQARTVGDGSSLGQQAYR